MKNKLNQKLGKGHVILLNARRWEIY